MLLHLLSEIVCLRSLESLFELHESIASNEQWWPEQSIDSDQARRQSVAASRIDGAQSTQQTRRTSQHVQIVTTQLPSPLLQTYVITVNALNVYGCWASQRPVYFTLTVLAVRDQVNYQFLVQFKMFRNNRVQLLRPIQRSRVPTQLKVSRRKISWRCCVRGVVVFWNASRRRLAYRRLSETLRKVVVNLESVSSWSDLMSFTFACFGVPGHRGGKRHLSSLASKVNQAIASFPTMSVSPVQNGMKPPKRRMQYNDIAARVSGKLEEGDIRGAIRLTQAMTSCHRSMTSRQRHCVRNIQSARKRVQLRYHPLVKTISVLESDILGAIKSFMPESAGGPDGLRPQHLKDLTCASTGDAGRRLLTLLTQFSNLCLAGRVPVEIQPVFCGASLCALNKKDGGIRPIAVGSTLRRLIAKTHARR